MKKVCYILVVLVGMMTLTACQPRGSKTALLADSLCMQAYRMRYTNIDSTEADLRRALKLVSAERFDEEKARALSLMGFVRYQQMDFGHALMLADSVDVLSTNQITLLCADILRMKVLQRISDAGRYYKASSSASRRLQRISNEKESLKDIDQQMFQYAETEYHFIASTYHYYQQRDSLSLVEMQQVEKQLEHLNDTTQKAYYYYMMGSGGLVFGDAETVLVKEFDYLLMAYTMSKRAGILYFEANALQAMATRLKTSNDRILISQRFPEAYQILVSQHLSWNFDEDDNDDSWLPTAMARHALHVFSSYRDLFQEACCYRTIGELEAYRGHYATSLDAFSNALSCVNHHHTTYYNCKGDTLSLYPNEVENYDSLKQQLSNISIERRWIEDQNILTVPDWMAGIRQQISLVYSCMDDNVGTIYNRNIYLDILECTSQNLEMESRLDDLQHQVSVQHRLMWAALIMLLIVLIMSAAIFFRQEIHDITHLQLINRKKGRVLRTDKHHLDELSDELDELGEKCEVSRMNITKYRSQGVEKRAKVSLVQGITPYIDRIINEVARMNRQPQPLPEQLGYVTELTDQIIEYNNILTEWIKIEQGQLSLHITTIDVEKLFDILRKGHFAFDQAGITLDVHHSDARIKADEALTLFMLNTLADNARKFTPKGGRVTIDASETEEYVELSVSDTGCGMSQQDVDTILQNKVYDASKIGNNNDQPTDKSETILNPASRKGHGFGLMNCKGIIEKYRKTSNIFSVCSFGIESKIGEGSRFYFRLPRVLMIVLAFMFAVKGYTSNPEYEYYERCFAANNENHPDDALSYADSALMNIDMSLVLYDSRVVNVSQTADIQHFMNADSLDYQLLVNLRNQIAVAALGVGDIELYNYNNNICTQLYRLLNEDSNLPTFYDQLKRTDANIRQITVALVLLSLLSIALIFWLIRNRKKLANQLTLDLHNKIEHRQDELNHLQFEENRYYVQNQVLDNCLSTIKHELMYFPSRINFLAQRMQTNQNNDDLKQLSELATYYRQLYTLLSGQAERQTQHNGIRVQKISIEDICNTAKLTFANVNRKLRGEASLTIDNQIADKSYVRADITVIEELFKQLFSYILTTYPTSNELRLHLEHDGSFIRLAIYVDGMILTNEEAKYLFTPSDKRIPLLVVKQIIRELDAINNNPGLRLVAESDHLWFTFASI